MAELELAATALLFDSDGVLVDSLSRVDDVWTAWARSFELDPAPILPVLHGRPAAETIAEVAPHIDHQLAVARLEQMEIDAVPGTRALPGANRLTSQLAPDVWAVVTSASQRLADVRLAGRVQVEPQEWADLAVSNVYARRVGVNSVDDNQVAVGKHDDPCLLYTSDAADDN